MQGIFNEYFRPLEKLFATAQMFTIWARSEIMLLLNFDPKFKIINFACEITKFPW